MRAAIIGFLIASVVSLAAQTINNVPPAMSAPVLIGNSGAMSGSGKLTVSCVTFPASTTLCEDAANTLAQRNSTNAQTFNVYGTFTDTSNYQRASLGAGTFHGTNGAMRLGVDAAGTGSAGPIFIEASAVFFRDNGTIKVDNTGLTVAGANLDLGQGATGFRDLYLTRNIKPIADSTAAITVANAGGSGQWTFDTSNTRFLAVTDNVGDIGASGANRPHNAFIHNVLTVGSDISCETGGGCTIGNNAGPSNVYTQNMRFGGGSTGTIATTNSGNPILISSAAPTISSGFGSTPSIVSHNGPTDFRVNVGTGGAATSGVIGLPTASNGWNCLVSDFTSLNSGTRQTASTTASATITTNAAWTSGDVLVVHCFAY